ncbi:MAG: hypothetical protein ACR2QK_10725 [Acidimicrobiales bacterium]
MQPLNHRIQGRPRRTGSGSAALLVAVGLLASGCSIVGDDGEQISGDVVAVDRDTEPDEQDGSSNDDQAGSGAQATFDSTESTSTPEPDETTTTRSPTTTEQDLVADSDFCQAPRRNNFEIEFDPGTSSTTIDSAAIAGQVDLYRLEVGQGQIMTIALTSPDPNAVATLLQPDGTASPGAFVDLLVDATQPGSYRICVTTGETGADYQLFVSVIDDNTPTRVTAPWCGDAVNDRGEIRFAAGRSSGQVENGLVRGERDLYQLDASAGQALDVLLSSLEDNAVFDLRTPSGELVIIEVSDFRIPLPESGTYEFCVGSLRGNASYTLDVSIQ